MEPDFLVVGAGVAGLRAAIELAQAGPVLVIAKDSLQESSSEYAQGGIAAAMGEDDQIELHEQDTLTAGDGLCNPEAVRVLVEHAPVIIQELIDWGAAFDRVGSKLALGREGAHSRRRILHAHGDSTGHEIAHALYHKAASLPNIEFRSFSAITDLLVTSSGEAAGVVACDASARNWVPLYAKAVLVATGGFGRLYRKTTNPDVATGDGVAAAYRAGAEISDIEFMQFHPTALDLPHAPAFLLTEALRGEGAYLRNAAGDRFMQDYDERSELAPRDIVARAMVAEMRRRGDQQVFLDIRHLGEKFLRARFPRVYETCLQYGIDLAKDLAPILPAAHYAMGGIRTDLEGRTSAPRLFAAGECACTGVHGANRLASNSLLEGLVFGARAGRAMREFTGTPKRTEAKCPAPRFPCVGAAELQTLAWEKCGIIRNGEELEETAAALEKIPTQAAAVPNRSLFETRSLYTVLWLMSRCALAREESRGAHFRRDFPEKRPEFQKHSVARQGRDVEFQE